jgi:hypothetical protein
MGRRLQREGQSTGDLGVLNVSNGKVERHLGWFDAPRVQGVSADGNALLVDESGDAATSFGRDQRRRHVRGRFCSRRAVRRRSASVPDHRGRCPPTGEPHWCSTTRTRGGSGLYRPASGSGGYVDFSGLSFVPWWSSFLPGSKRAVVPAEGTEGYPRSPAGLPVRSIAGPHPTPPALGPLSPDGRFLARFGGRQPDGVSNGSGFCRLSPQGVSKEDALIAVDSAWPAGLT